MFIFSFDYHCFDGHRNIELRMLGRILHKRSLHHLNIKHLTYGLLVEKKLHNQEQNIEHFGNSNAGHCMLF